MRLIIDRDVPVEMREACAVVVDGGELPGVPSTVVDLTGPVPEVLRWGRGALAPLGVG